MKIEENNLNLRDFTFFVWIFHVKLKIAQHLEAFYECKTLKMFNIHDFDKIFICVADLSQFYFAL